MNTHRIVTHRVVSLAASALILVGAGCSKSESDTPVATPEFEADTSYLDGLAEEQGIDTSAPAQATTQEAVDETTTADDKVYTDEEREWTQEEGSKSLLGRSRDRAKDLRDQIQGSTEPENGIANTVGDEEYAQAAGFAWDMPTDWRMAVPSSGHFGEMYIQNQLGNASVVFTKESDSIAQIKRALESTITDTFSGRSSAKVTTKEVMGFKVTILDLQGTYIDPSAKGTSNGNPFYSIHAAIIELPTTKVLIKLWGPQDTVDQSKAKFDAMIEKMYER